jgi:lipoyl(octanoyl) transferase
LSWELGRDVPVSEVLPHAKELVLAALDGTLPVADHWLPQPTSPEIPGVTFALRS